MTNLKRFLPAIIFLVAFGYRLMGISWGLPSAQHHQSYHPDEEVIWNYSQQLEPAKLKLTPGFYNYGTLYLTTLKVASDMVGVYGGHMPQPEGVPASSPTLTDWEFVGRSHLAGRVISAIFGALIPLFVFLILRRWTNDLGASLGALLTAFSPGMVVHSRFQTVDIMAAGLLVISAYYALRLIPNGQPEDVPTGRFKWFGTAIGLAVMSGVLAGLSAGTKYTGFLGIFTLIAALWLAKNPDRMKLSLAGLAAMMAAFVFATPGVLLETEKFIRDFKFEMLHTSTGHGLIFEKVGNGFLYHFGNLLQVITPFGLLLGMVGCQVLLWKAVVRRPSSEAPPVAHRIVTSDNAWMWALMAFALPYYILIGRAEVLFLRYTFPLVLIVACGFGWMAGRAHEKKGGWLALPILSILSLGGALLLGSRFTTWMSTLDPRDQAALYLKEQSQPNEVVGLVSDPWYYTPSLFPDSALSRMPVVDKGNGTLPFIYQMRVMQQLTDPGVVRYIPADDAGARFDWDVRLLNEVKPDYVTYSSFEAFDLIRLSKRTDLAEIPKLFVDRFNEFQAELEKNYTPVRSFGDPQAMALAHDLMYIQPYVTVWKRKS